MCSFSKLFRSVSKDYKCDGKTWTLSELDESAKQFYKDYKIFGDCSLRTVSDIIMNKVTPHMIEATQIALIEICDNHRKCLTFKHKSVRQKKCCMEDCSNSGDITKRLSFEAVNAIFQATSEHVYVGSAICIQHRKMYLGPRISPAVSSQPVTSEPLTNTCPISASPIDSCDAEICVSKFNDVQTDDALNNEVITSSCKRKAFNCAIDNFSKLLKSDSEKSSAVGDSQTDSQVSNASASSDIQDGKDQNKFEKLVTCLNDIDPSLKLNNRFDLSVQERSLKEYANVIGNIWELVLKTLTYTSPNDVSNKQFVKMVIDSIQSITEDEKQKQHLALNILSSLADYYKLACQNSSRSAEATKKQILLSITGVSVRSANQLGALACVLGARKPTVLSVASKRFLLEDKGSILPYLQVLDRKSPEGSKIVSVDEKLETILFYESDLVSEPLKGHNNVLKEVVSSPSGEKFIINRQKRVLKVQFVDLLRIAQKEIGFKYSYRTLMKLRPGWVVLTKEAHALTCLCDRCLNIQLILKALAQFSRKIKQFGSPADKAALAQFSISTSLSDFIASVLHPKEEGRMWHDPDCYNQRCVSSDVSPCGTKKLMLLFQPLLLKFGDSEVQLHQHLVVNYIKADGSRGSKMEEVVKMHTIKSVVETLNSRVFGHYHKQPYVQHRLKMLLGSKMRQDIHQNIDIYDAVCWSDYSKELEVNSQEQCKSSAFGASNVTIQLIGQVYELVMLPPSCPTNVKYSVEDRALSFAKPCLDGGSNIQNYEVHIKQDYSNEWFLFKVIKVQYLSQEATIDKDFFGRLSGKFNVRIHARNLCGLGAGYELNIELDGDLPLIPEDMEEISENSFVQKYATFLVEFFFFSDHNDAPKNWKTVQKCKEIALGEIRKKFQRDIKRLICVTDTGGENSGSTVSKRSKLLTFYIYSCRRCAATHFRRRIWEQDLCGLQPLLITPVCF